MAYKYLDSTGLAWIFNKIKANITQYYEHNVRVSYVGTSGTVALRFKLVTTSATALTYNSLCYALNSNGYLSQATALLASGMVYTAATSTDIVTGVFCTSSTTTGTTLSVEYTELVYRSSSTATILTRPRIHTTTTVSLSSSYTINDYVRTL